MNPQPLEFKTSRAYSMGVELELQILNCRDHNLARDAADLIGLIDKGKHPGEVKPEITESMIEVNTSIHHEYGTLAEELIRIRDVVAQAAARINLRIAGGGSHPFHKWSERRIYPTERFKHLLELYGYLAKQFTIFGQHVHIGVPDGDTAPRVMDRRMLSTKSDGVSGNGNRADGWRSAGAGINALLSCVIIKLR